MAFQRPTFRLFCMTQNGEVEFCVTVRDYKLVLTLPVDNDLSQLWYKDESDPTGYTLESKAYNQTVRYSDIRDQLDLTNTPTNPDQSFYWTNSYENPPINGFTYIETSRNKEVVMDVCSGVIFDGVSVSINRKSNSGYNLRWKLVPYSPPLYKLYCKRKGEEDLDYCVTVRDGKLVLDISKDYDITQIWYKDCNDYGFMLVNKATGKVVQHSDVGVQLELVNKPDNGDPSIMWTASEDVGDGYTFIRTGSDVGLVMGAWEGHIKDGTLVSIYPNASSDNEYWKLVPYSPPNLKLFNAKASPNGEYCVAVGHDKLLLAHGKDCDPTQLWYKDSYDIGFVLMNKALEKPVRYSGVGDQLELVDKPLILDESFLWTSSSEFGARGFTSIRTLSDVGLVMTACWDGPLIGGATVSIDVDLKSDNQLWKII